MSIAQPLQLSLLLPHPSAYHHQCATAYCQSSCPLRIAGSLQVRALQQQQLEELLVLLKGVKPFADLGRQKLISLAIFVRPLAVTKDQTIVKQGEPVDTFYLISTGQVLLTVALDNTSTASASTSRVSTPATHLGRSSSFQRSFRRSTSLGSASQLALLGPGDSFGDEVCGLPTVEDDSRLTAAVMMSSHGCCDCHAAIVTVM